MKLSIVIVNYNVRYFLEQCLLSVQDAIRDVEAEVFVVDNRSGDGSCAMVREKFSWVKLIENKENLGFSKANNQAMRQAQGEYILLLNPDTVVEEHTFKKCMDFMDAHPDAGGLGVKMIDGKGNFLPESKRGLPTPEVAFYKVFGLAALFPKSKRFGQYHLSYLDKDETHTIDILAGAFMLMRSSVLKKVGLLDEAFFMYGEDIDLSWRIRLAGYKNYYFPETQIIHYKGESTKKSSINYVFVFYNAMIIFARKHFSKSRAGLFTLLIQMAIYIRAGIAILRRIAKNSWIPLMDFLIVLCSFWGIQYLYSWNTGIQHPRSILLFLFPGIAFIFNLVLTYSAAYDTPFRFKHLFRGLAVGSALILMGYALLPEALRFSRLVILVGSVTPFLLLPLFRILLNLIGTSGYQFHKNLTKRLALVGEWEELERVKEIIKKTLEPPEVLIEVVPQLRFRNPTDHFVAHVGQLKELTTIFNLNEVIFCGKSMSSEAIMQEMSYLENPELEFKIAPKASNFIIGSSSIHTSGTLYALENLNNIISAQNKRVKRTIDVAVSILVLLLSPLVLLTGKNGRFIIHSAWKTLLGASTWIGFYPVHEQINILPKLKSAIFYCGKPRYDNSKCLDQFKNLNLNYANNYNSLKDIQLLAHHFVRSTSNQ